jgi:hypothetical protein
MSWLSTWLFNPAMLGIGAAAVLSPIIIHLLNKRRFRIVEWAAMDFLFDADRKNRRRVRLENFLLLLLRCLAMLLLGLLLARPFLPSQLAGLLGQAREFQRVILLDDSLSQQVMVGNQSAFDMARDRLKQLLQGLATDGGSDWLTLYLTSQPDSPLIANEPLTLESLNPLIARIDELKCSETSARYAEALAEIDSFVRENRSSANRVVYVMTDLRRRDWQGAETVEDGNAPRQRLAAINETVPNTFLVDVGSELEENLVIADVAVDDLLVSDTVVRFTASVTNFGTKAAEAVELQFRVDDAQPQSETIPSIPPGESRSATFRHMFQYDRDSFAELDLQQQLLKNRLNARLHIEIVPRGENHDFLEADSEYFVAARVLKRLPILIVDGDPSSVEERSESYYLRGIGLPGTGLVVDTVTAGELETVALGKYEVVFLCNVDEASADRIDVLKQWVMDGGGLVFMPGDRVRASRFNNAFFREGSGLSPLGLDVAAGDPARLDWVYMELQDPRHPAFRVALDDEVGMGQVEVFSWWKTLIAPGQLGVSVAVPLMLTDPDHSAAMGERTLGKGHVVTFAFPGDADWTLWAAHPTFVCVMWDLVNYLTGHGDEAAGNYVGSDLNQIVDLTLYDRDVSLVDSQGEKTLARAQSLDPSDDSAGNVLYQVHFPALPHRGFWQMDLKQKNGELEPRLFAANVDPREGDLQRVDVAALPNAYFGKTTLLLNADELMMQGESGTSNEIWPQLLLLLAGILGLEQFLGWAFGRRR